MSTRSAEGLRLRKAEVKSNDQIALGIFRLTFPRDRDFIPGQTLALTTDPAISPRYYSIASGANDALFEILYDLVPEGQLTPRLARLGAGRCLACVGGARSFP